MNRKTLDRIYYGIFSIIMYLACNTFLYAGETALIGKTSLYSNSIFMIISFLFILIIAFFLTKKIIKVFYKERP